MKKQKKLIVGNWKMNPVSLYEAKKLALDIKRVMRGIKKTQVVICPPFVYISPLSSYASSSFILGAQNSNHENIGSYTGEVSYSFLPQFKVGFVIVGHSERRKMGETDELINSKVKSVVNEGMTAIICVGEATRDHNGDYLDFIKNQISLALKDVNKKLLNHIVIAYEPIWAVGAKEAMSPRDLHEMSIFIKKVLRDSYGVYADDTRILYGGDANVANADRLVNEGNVSGLLIGRESLNAKDFIQIIKLIDKTK